MDRIATPTSVFTAAPPRAGLIEDMERDDNRRGPEPEDSALRLRTVIHCPVRGEQR